MKAMLVYEIGQPFQEMEVELDEPMPNEVVVTVKASGLCHSDLHIIKADYGWPRPFIPGHEVAGVVEKVGANVTRMKVGDHVVTNLITSCGQCAKCQSGVPTSCSNPGAILRGPEDKPRITVNGEPVHQIGNIGGFAEKVLVHERNLVVIGQDIPLDRAALLGCGVITGFGAAKNAAKIRVGDDVAVTGCGGIGLNVVQGAAFSGAHHIIAIDIQPAKLELAKKFGATDVINSAEEDVVARVKEITGRTGVDVAFEAIGLESTVDQSVEILDTDGRVYVLGMMRPGTFAKLSGVNMLRQHKSIIGVYMGNTISDIDIPLYADLYRQGRINLDDLISNRIALSEINEGYEKLEKGETARSVVVFD